MKNKNIKDLYSSIFINSDPSSQIDLKRIITEFPYALSDRDKLKGILNDLYPTEYKKANILIECFDIGIVDKIKNNNLSISESLLLSYSSMLEKQFNYRHAFAMGSVLLWALSLDKINLENETEEDQRKFSSYIENFGKVSNLPDIEERSFINHSLLYYAEKYFDKQQYEEAFMIYKKVADDKNDLYATYITGVCYEEGLGIDRSLENATKYFKLATEFSKKNGIDDSLSNVYYIAMSFYKLNDYNKALIWFSKGEALNNYDSKQMIKIIRKALKKGDRK